jgi:site-specific DNA recombinase
MVADKLDKAGADLVSLSERIDTTTAAGKMVFRMLAVLTEFERDQISERTSAILQHKKAKGEVYSPIPFGFRQEGDKLLIDEEEQDVIRHIKELKMKGLSLRRIAAKLNKQGTPAKRGGVWYASSVREMVNREE